MEEALVLMLGFAALVLMGLFIVWHFARSNTMLRRWAEESGYRIVSRERRWLRRGPFWWRTAKGQEVFYVTLEDAAGQRRSAWVRCGGWFLGLLADSVTVEWDE